MQPKFPQEMQQDLLADTDAAENRRPQRSRWYTPSRWCSKAGWRDIIVNIKNNQLAKSLTEIAAVTAINECVGLSIKAATNGGYFFLREAFAIMCAPTVANNLQLTPKLLYKLTSYPKTKAILSQIIKHTTCVTIWTAPAFLFNTHGAADPIESISIQYLTAELLVLALDMGILTNPPSNTNTHPNSSANKKQNKDTPSSDRLPLLVHSSAHKSALNQSDIESGQFIRKKEQ
ncbi:hypothetical protein M1466_01565 [Candidatus Dependentiae bacterium]|nr:hypothetical protein [Candidatus Dependentiae bacterium]